MRTKWIQIYVILTTTVIAWGQLLNNSYGPNLVKDGLAVMYREGDVMLASLIPQHSRFVANTSKCELPTAFGVQALEAINVILDQVNSNASILPGVKLGMIGLDTCGDDTHAVYMVLSRVFPYFWRFTPDPFAATPELFAGVIGAAFSSVTILVSKVLRVREIPLISYYSTNADLSDKTQHKFVFRSVPSDVNQVEAMLKMLYINKWKYFSVVYADTFYGSRAYKVIQERFEAYNLCKPKGIRINSNTVDADYDDVIAQLVERKKARAVIAFLGPAEAQGLPLLRAASRSPLARGHFIWIGSDGFTSEVPDDVDSVTYKEELNNVIGFQPKTNRWNDFDRRFSDIKLMDRSGKKAILDPWFAEYFAEHRNCSLNATTSSTTCKQQDRLVENEHFNQEGVVQYVYDATWSYIHALNALHKDLCGGSAGLCPKMKQMGGSNKLAKAIYPYLQSVSFPSIDGSLFSFDSRQDGPDPPQYELLVCQQPSDSAPKWTVAATYRMGTIVEDSRHLLSKFKRIASVCSNPCQLAEKKIHDNENQCCWKCERCGVREYVSSNQSLCLQCSNIERPNENFSGCEELENRNIQAYEYYAIVPGVISVLGFAVTIFIGGIYFYHHTTPIVRATSKELSIFIYVGAAICLASGFVLFGSVTPTTCSILRALISIGPTFMYSGLLTKTIRVVIIFQSRSILKPYIKAFIRSKPQVISTILLIAIQILILVIWFVVEKTEVLKVPHDEEHLHFDCRSIQQVNVLIGLAYPFLLIIICTVLATINRNVPTGFKETRYVGFTMYTTCVIWFAFASIVLTNSTHTPLRIMLTPISLSLQAVTVIVWMFAPRCYDIIFHPERNTQSAVMDSFAGKIRSSGGSVASKAKTRESFAVHSVSQSAVL